MGSLLCGVYLMSGPIVGGLVNRYGCRPVCIAGLLFVLLLLLLLILLLLLLLLLLILLLFLLLLLLLLLSSNDDKADSSFHPASVNGFY